MNKNKKQYPFTIHVPKDDAKGFPTHTHGITELGTGLPEFIMDPLAFGQVGNGQRINGVYDYLMKPRNAKLIEGLKKGETLKIHSRQLHKKVNEEYTYCVRRVFPTFEAVKQAYVLESSEDFEYLNPDMWFVQIYVEGDDYALTDEYYKGGVKW